MNHPTIRAVVLCGGSGTRLWPLSRQSFPKQFVPLIGNQSLLQCTLQRLRHLDDEPLCVAAEEHRFLVQDALQALGMQADIVLEPAGRNTAAAMALAALHQTALGHGEDLLLFCPADHHIPDEQAFADMVRKACPAALGAQDPVPAMVTFGVVPHCPSTAYGYIAQAQERADGCWAVARFIEKPNRAKAEALLLQGQVLWNAGIFLCRADVLLQALRLHAGDILQVCEAAMQNASTDGAFLRPQKELFLSCRSESIDYAVMEHHQPVAVMPFAGRWSDVGSWNAVADLIDADAAGNRIDGRGLVFDASNTYVHAPERTVVALGTRDLLIVDTPDALLVAQRDHAEQVKAVVAELQKRHSDKAVLHRKVSRPWGWYDSIDQGERFQVKRISVKPGAALSLQLHHHRAEHWIVVKGVAKVTNGDRVFLLQENESTYIPIGVKHRLENPGEIALEMIEVQSGSYLGEDDIVRFDDVYGRR